MIVLNAVTPSPKQAAGFFGGEEAPFVMLNLSKLKSCAEYPDGRDAHLIGFEAHIRCGMAVGAYIERVDGKPGYVGRVTGLMFGDIGELWDMVVLAQYPSLPATRARVEDPDDQAIGVHRSARLGGQLNLKTQGASL